VTGIPAGLFVTLFLADRADEDALVSAAAGRGVGLEEMAGDGAGLILGFGNLPRAAITEGVRRLAGM
jgi:DNA-binding transcriptional MocR family regulator